VFTPENMVLIVLVATVAVLQLLALLRTRTQNDAVQRLDSLLREELARNRDAGSADARALREEVTRNLRDSAETAGRGLGQLGDAQRDQLRLFSERLESLTQSLTANADRQRQEQAQKVRCSRAHRQHGPSL